MVKIVVGFTKRFEVRWDDLDPNRHVANIAYSKWMTHVRFALLTENGFSQRKFQELGFGPVILSETFYYQAEVVSGETVTVDVQLLGMSADRRFYAFAQNVYKESGDVAAVGVPSFGWLSLETRKMISPPSEILDIITKLERHKKFYEIGPEHLKKLRPQF